MMEYLITTDKYIYHLRFLFYNDVLVSDTPLNEMQLCCFRPFLCTLFNHKNHKIITEPSDISHLITS